MNSVELSNYELKNVEDGTKVRREEIRDTTVVKIISGNDSSGPRDIYNLVYIVLLIHGVGTLLPWNMFINADDYFRSYKLNSTLASPDTDRAKLEALNANFLPYLSVAGMFPNALFSGLNLIVDVSSENLNFRINLALAFEALIVVFTIVLAFVDSSSWPITFFYLTLSSISALQTCSGIYSTSLFGVSARLPSSYVNAILIGTNTSGVFISLVKILCMAISLADHRKTGLYYFSAALSTLVTCLISYNLLSYSSFFKYHDKRAAIQENTVQKKNRESLPGQDTSTKVLIADDPYNDIPDTLKQTVEAMTQPQEPPSSTFAHRIKTRWEVLRVCWAQCLNVFLVFAITLSLFPSIVADIRPNDDIINKDYHAPVFVFLAFNLFAMLGNVTPSFTTWPGKDRVWMLVVLRLLFVPFFLICNFIPETRKWPVLIKSDVVFIIGNIVFAWSSGYLSSLAMLFVSSGLTGDQAIIARMLGSFSLTLGLLVGAYSSFLLTWVVS